MQTTTNADGGGGTGPGGTSNLPDQTMGLGLSQADFAQQFLKLYGRAPTEADWQQYQQLNTVGTSLKNAGATGPVTPPAPPAPGGGGGGPYGSSFPSENFSPDATPFEWPTFTAPDFTPDAPFNAPAPFSYADFKGQDPFTYQDFQAPTLEQAQGQPGYQFAVTEGRKALENAAAAKGTLRTGGTLKDLFNWSNQAATQNYGNVYNQNLNTYGTNRANAYGNYATNEQNMFDTYKANRSNAADAYATNYGVAKDVYGLNHQANLDTWNIQDQRAIQAFNPQFQSAQLSFADLYNRWRDKLNALTNISTAGAA